MTTCVSFAVALEYRLRLVNFNSFHTSQISRLDIITNAITQTEHSEKQREWKAMQLSENISFCCTLTAQMKPITGVPSDLSLIYEKNANHRTLK